MKRAVGRIRAFGMIAGMLLASASGAATKTATVSKNGLSFVVVPLFDPALGTLLSVYAEATYTSNLPYLSSVAPIGYNSTVTGTAVLGGLTFALTGASQANQSTGYGIFTVTASGNASWSDPTQLGIFAIGAGTLLGTASAYAPAPGTQMAGNYSPAVNYSLTYTYDDNTPAVPEPATWAMMAGGFALMGLALRAARRDRAEGEAAANA